MCKLIVVSLIVNLIVGCKRLSSSRNKCNFSTVPKLIPKLILLIKIGFQWEELLTILHEKLLV